ncbi:energy transducer TonB [Caulobacter sp. S45]|uniref:energy transducer TonB n=1 Tax=Caulobacter sp. S45 TaxID=1641861 RepID=UPI00131DF629|nr:energy transducer TonB [Caulobacter sp. S45]
MLVTMMALALAQTPEASAPQQPVYDAAFRPLKKSERSYTRLGPVGPYYPQVAVDARKNGEAILSCRIAPGGELDKCKPVAESPANLNFAVAARVMADRKRIFVTGDPPIGEGVLVRVPFVIGAPATTEP